MKNMPKKSTQGGKRENKKSQDAKKSKDKKFKSLKDYQPHVKEDAGKKKHRPKRLHVMIILLIIFLLVLSLILLIELNIIKNPIENFNLQPKLFTIKDDCTMIVGNLIHKIKDEGGCEMACKTECGVRDMNFHSSEFIMSERDCHSCNCYCI